MRKIAVSQQYLLKLVINGNEKSRNGECMFKISFKLIVYT